MHRLIYYAGDSLLRVVFETHATGLDNEAGLASGWFDVWKHVMTECATAAKLHAGARP